ncbi:hypothetical protein M8J75_012974 [Diaphorina citri]|nr:hypothetical protein M8J75_012974 [Diaphorina citri]KAI5725530.1 hypothetical protein M8J77_016668 [Diaphorina citri]
MSERPGSFWPMAERESYARAPSGEPGTHLPLRSYARAPSGGPVRTRNTPPVPFEAMPGLLLANQSEPGTHLQFQKPVDP